MYLCFGNHFACILTKFNAFFNIKLIPINTSSKSDFHIASVKIDTGSENILYCPSEVYNLPSSIIKKQSSKLKFKRSLQSCINFWLVKSSI